MVDWRPLEYFITCSIYEVFLWLESTRKLFFSFRIFDNEKFKILSEVVKKICSSTTKSYSGDGIEIIIQK